MDTNELLGNLQHIVPLEENDCNAIFNKITKLLDGCGFMYRAFYRQKSIESIKKKITKKAEEYIHENRKMTDILGIRIVLYFIEDIPLCQKVIEDNFRIIECVHDRPDPKTFSSQRLNLVFAIPDEINGISAETQEKCLIDNTFELQIRTIFSEGWHEVEHDVRYKYPDDWNDEPRMLRDLYGLLATLEICDQVVMGILDNVAYDKYKNHSWEAMIRNRFRLRFKPTGLSSNLNDQLNKNEKFAKAVFRFSKEDLVKLFSLSSIDISYDNVIYLINHYHAPGARIAEIEDNMPENVKNAIYEKIKGFKKSKSEDLPYRSIVAKEY